MVFTGSGKDNNVGNYSLLHAFSLLFSISGVVTLSVNEVAESVRTSFRKLSFHWYASFEDGWLILMHCLEYNSKNGGSVVVVIISCLHADAEVAVFCSHLLSSSY